MILCFIILLVACENKQSNTASQQNLHPKTNKVKTILHVKSYDDTIYKDSMMLVIKSEKSVDTLFKFHSNLGNKKFEVKVKNLKLNKSLNFKKYEYKKMFITVTKEGVKEDGVNFAGKFCFVYWGCGSPCQTSAVVDMESGIVYNGLPSSVGYKFKKNSRILILNPPEDSTNYYPKHRWVPYPKEYVWAGKRFVETN
jgi:major membrane immunogen (membrane-anchored lipoprotein)